MKRVTKRTAGLLAALLLSLSLFPLGAMAEEVGATVEPADTLAIVAVDDNTAAPEASATETPTVVADALAEAAGPVAQDLDTPAPAPAPTPTPAPAPAADADAIPTEADTVAVVLDDSQPAAIEAVATAPEAVDADIPTDTADAPASLSAAPKLSAPLSYQSLSAAADIAKLTFSKAFHTNAGDFVINATKSELSVAGTNIILENGAYNYQLYANKAGRMIFDNDLAIAYQGVDGKYNLHYDMVDADNHIMIVNGTFNNLLTASPLLQQIRDRISEDSYSYQLNLRTTEGFTFNNRLSYLYNGSLRGFMINFSYDKATNSQSLVIDGLPETMVYAGQAPLRQAALIQSRVHAR